jgi:ABC-type nitrate/sulfonate/bicarbonate transport system substrate-binding protein
MIAQNRLKEWKMIWKTGKLKACVVSLAVAFGAVAVSVGASNAQEHSLTIAIAKAGADTWPVFAGIERGVFEKHGLDLKAYTGVQSGPEAIRVMQAGDADLAAAGSGPTAAASIAGIPLKLVVLLSGGYKNDDLYATVTVESSGIRPGHPEDLSGKRVGVTFGTTPHEQLLATMADKGVDMSTVNLSNIKPADLAIALQQKSVDAVVAWEPVVTHMLNTIPGAEIVIRGGGYVSGNAGIAAMQQVIDEKPEAVKRFVAALSEINHWIRHNRDATAEIGTRVQAGLDVEVAKSVLQHFGFDPRISKLNIKGIDEGNLFLQEQGNLDGAVDANDIVDATFINQVVEENPEYFDDLEPIAEENMIK